MRKIVFENKSHNIGEYVLEPVMFASAASSHNVNLEEKIDVLDKNSGVYMGKKRRYHVMPIELPTKTTFKEFTAINYVLYNCNAYGAPENHIAAILYICKVKSREHASHYYSIFKNGKDRNINDAFEKFFNGDKNAFDNF